MADKNSAETATKAAKLAVNVEDKKAAAQAEVDALVRKAQKALAEFEKARSAGRRSHRGEGLRGRPQQASGAGETGSRRDRSWTRRRQGDEETSSPAST